MSANWKANSAQFYSSEPLGTAEVAERRVLAEIGSEKLLRAIILYIERHHPEVLVPANTRLSPIFTGQKLVVSLDRGA